MKKFFLSFILAGAAATTVLAASKPIDHGKLDSILKANTDDQGFIDYSGIRANKGGDIYEYLTGLEVADLTGINESEKLAFWINAYNANMIKLILARPELKLISDDLKLFDQKIKIAGFRVSLNDIEHRVIRSDVNRGGAVQNLSVLILDQRIHFALNYGAIGSPKLSNRAFAGATLDTQLQNAAINFANNPKNLRIEDGKLIASSLLKLYEQDFATVGGVAVYLSGLTDIKKRADADEIDAKLKTDFPANTDFQFDWSVNDVKNKK